MEHIATIKHCIEMPKDTQNKVETIKYINIMDIAGNLVPVDVKGVNGAWGGNVPMTRTLSGTFGISPLATCLKVCSSCGQSLPQSS